MLTKKHQKHKEFWLLHFAIFILQCCIHQIALGEVVNTRVCRKA